MPKPAVVLILVITMIPFITLLSSAPPSGPRKMRARRLHRHLTFDPLVDKLEPQINDDVHINVHAFWKKMREDDGMLKDYFTEEGSLNTEQRLRHLFAILDQSPKDGFLSFGELDVWNKRQALDRLMYITERRMSVHDKDENGEVTLSELLWNIPEAKRDWNDKEFGEPGWWKDLFECADEDGNGSLSELELNDLVHPEDSKNPKVQAWFLREKLSEMDVNEDGKLSFEEFRDRTHSIFTYAHDFETKDVSPMDISAIKKFQELDVNKDKFITPEELKPVIHQLHPGEFSYATYYTKYLMHKADDDKDGKLTLEEMLDHPQEFYDAVFEEGQHNYHYGEENDYGNHDEF
ncbi:uncharacterized protein A4U43_C01F9100 [Asparagus officinalis]|uniref:EF-hand domain-containing protein n=1 Tax=Asparagus officinalis TaxID=4686 RepID=A0A5P1FN13_ASPOF|nr:calumenin [Asparagus officinalis]ONK79695.1 uncharacterized protein A4U43_C01F9100 [Asparagus officinalis]